MKYLDHKKMPCTFVLQGGKSLKGIIDGRDTYTIFVQTEEKTYCLFKDSVMDIIPAEKLDLKEIKDITFIWNQEQMSFKK